MRPAFIYKTVFIYKQQSRLDVLLGVNIIPFYCALLNGTYQVTLHSTGTVYGGFPLKCCVSSLKMPCLKV